MLKNVIILVTINLYFVNLAAQIEQPVRYELTKINKENYYSVVSAHEFGIVIFRESYGKHTGPDWPPAQRRRTERPTEKEFPQGESAASGVPGIL